MNTEKEKYIKKLNKIGFGLIDCCDLCGNDLPIHKYDPHKEKEYSNYLEYNGKQLLCLECK